MVRRVGSRGDTTGTTAPRTRLLGRCGTVDRGAPQVAAVALDLHAARVLAGRRRPGSRGGTRNASLRTGAGAVTGLPDGRLSDTYVMARRGMSEAAREHAALQAGRRMVARGERPGYHLRQVDLR